MPDVRKRYTVRSRDFVNAGKASVQVNGILKSIGFDPVIVRRAAICAYESEMNIVMHGDDGELTLTVSEDQIVIEARDTGPGIEDVELAFQEGFSTASTEQQELGFGAGMGLPNIRKNTDVIEIRSKPGEGTYLKMIFRTRSTDDRE